ncbi:MAG: LptA/OstA family protein, partial [Endomicrobiia bacterium]
MKKNIFKLTLMFLLIDNIAVAESAIVDSSDKLARENFIEIKADKLEYIQTQNKISAEGNVEISSGTLKIDGEKLQIDIKEKYIIMDGSVTLNEGLYFITGDKCEYSLEYSTGYIYKAKGYFEPWYFESEKVFKNKNIYILGKSKFSTCSKPKPHYVMSVSKAKITTGNKIQANDAIMHLGPVPVSYMPTVSYSLKKRRDCFEIYPGYNSRDGLSAKIKYSFPVNKHSYSKLHLDYYSEQNIGKGIEYNYNFPEKAKGTIYAYHIRDNKTQNERWTITNSHWQKLTKTWSFQTSLNFLSDEYFNKYYFGENWNRKLSQINSSVALTRQTKK